MPPGTRTKPINTTKPRGDADRPPNIRPNAQRTTPRTNERALAARTAARDQGPVERVHALSEDVVVRVGHHHRLREIGFHVEHGTEAAEGLRDGLIDWGWVVC